MSLINDALKKAQKLQTQQPSAPPAGPTSSGPVPATGAIRRGKSVGIETMLLGLVALVLVFVGLAVVAMLVFRKGEKPALAAAPRAAVSAPAVPTAPAPALPTVKSNPPSMETTAPGAPGKAPASPAEAAPETSLATVAVALPRPTAPEPSPVKGPPPAVAPATPSPASAAEQASPAISVQINTATRPSSDAANASPAPVAMAGPASTQPAAHPALPAPPQQSRKILVYISNLRVTGVRVAGSESKVLMNDRLYRMNDMVDYELGLRLTGIITTELTFVDENGVTYTKTL